MAVGPSVWFQGLWAVFLSTFEKQLDAKRRIVVPQEFRAQTAGPFDGVFCFPSIEADCIEGGGKALFDRYAALIEELEFGDPIRSALEQSVFGGMAQLSVWTALANAGVGASLQHYNPLIDAAVAREWNIPAFWKLRAKMPFGSNEAGFGEKAFMDDAERFRVAG